MIGRFLGIFTSKAEKLEMFYHIFISNNINLNTGSATAISSHGQITGQNSDNTISSLS
jgi:hypothetical protein